MFRSPFGPGTPAFTGDGHLPRCSAWWSRPVGKVSGRWGQPMNLPPAKGTDASSAFTLSSHHPRAESRQLSVGSGASGSVPKGIRTVMQVAELPAIQLVLVA